MQNLISVAKELYDFDHTLDLPHKLDSVQQYHSCLHELFEYFIAFPELIKEKSFEDALKSLYIFCKSFRKATESSEKTKKRIHAFLKKLFAYERRHKVYYFRSYLGKYEFL